MKGRIAIAVVAAMLGIFFMGSTLLTPLLVIYEKTFGFSKVVLTLIYAVYVVGNLGALLFLGRLSDQAGRRRTTLLAMALASIGGLLFLFASGTAWLFWARVLIGFAIGIGSGTTTAWLAELYGAQSRSLASVVASGANMSGIALGPLLAGVLAEYAPWPLRLSYVVYLAVLVGIGLLIWRTRETVTQPVDRLRDLSLRPRIGVPRGIRAQFLAPAVTAFVTFAVGGFYAALIPSFLAEHLHQANHAIGGAVVFELFGVAALAIFITQRLKSRTAMLGGLLLTLPGLASLVTAQALGSLTILLLGTTFGGIAFALSYRGSLQVVNEIAPEERRAEVVSSYLVAGFSGNSLPVIGVGVLSGRLSPFIANAVFAGVLAVLAVAALLTGARYIPKA